jgi:hypothetical protein
MSSPMAVSCPHCGAGLKLKNNSFVGKKVPCPKCKQPFVVEEPPQDEFLSQDDDYGAMEEAEEEPEEPRPKSKAKGSKGGKGKKKSKSGGFAPIAMIAGGTVMGIGLLGGIIYGAMSLFSGKGEVQPVVAIEPAAAKDEAAPPKLGDSVTDITSYPGQVIDAGEKSKDKINTLNDQYQADLEAQMQEGGAAHAAPAATPAATPTGVHAVPAAAPATPAANAGGNDPAKAVHAAPAAVPAENAAGADPAKAVHAAAPAGADGQIAGQPAEKSAVPKSRSRRRTTDK